LKRSAVVLAGGFSKRFGRDKGLVELAGKPLVLHVLDRMFGVVNETLVVVSSNRQKVAFERSLGQRARVIIDKREEKSPLIGALTGFEFVQGEYSLVLPCDTPFVSSNIASLLLNLCINRSAVIPRWPNGYIEPLQAAYHTRSALTAARAALEQGKLDLRSMIACLRGVRYVSTMVLQQLDPKLLTFFNVNNLGDLGRAESMLKRL
jgi:molybdopterin-guanine dinucleotide biosynthesis protein A